MMDRRNFLQMTTGSALTSMLMLNGCWNPFTSNQNQEEMSSIPKNNVLRLAITAPPSTFNPALSSTQAEYSVANLVFNGLVRLDETRKPRADLAESWTHTDDHLSWTFKLRQNVKFHHDKALLTADDVVYTFERILNGKPISPLGFTLNSIKDTKSLDKYTVHFTLEIPNVDFLLLLSEPQAKIISKEQTPESLDHKPLGTGPFKFDTYTQGESLILKRNSDYWDPDISSKVTTIEHYYVPSQERKIKMLVDDEVDVIPRVSFDQSDQSRLKNNPDIEIKTIPNAAYTTIVMHVTEPPFDDSRVREALKHCIDRQALIESSVYADEEEGNDHPLSSLFGDYQNSGLPPRGYAPDRASELLEEAGYSDGLTLDLVTSEVSSEMIWLAEQFRDMASKAGVNINVVSVPTSVYWSDYWNQHPRFFMGSWSLRPSLSETLMLAYHSESPWNEGGWYTDDLDELISSAQAELDEDRRIELYHKAQKLIYDEGPVIIPCFRRLMMAKRKSVQGLKPHRVSRINLETLQVVVEED